MSSTIPLTLAFEITQENPEAPYDVALVSIEPHGVSLHPNFKGDCYYCNSEDAEHDESRVPPKIQLCDACAVAQTIDDLGTDFFLKNDCGITLSRTGTLFLKGRYSWHVYNTVDFGFDYDQEFSVETEFWKDLPESEEIPCQTQAG